MKVVLKKKRHLDVEEHVSLFYHCHLKVDICLYIYRIPSVQYHYFCHQLYTIG